MKGSNNIQDFNFSEKGKLTSEEITDVLKSTCHYVDYVEFTKNSKEQLVALIFPQNKLLSQPDYKKSPEEGCFCPRSLDEVGRCLTGCLGKVNNEIGDKTVKISLAIIVGEKYLSDNGKLTDSAEEKLKDIIEKYKTQPAQDDVYIIDLESGTD